MAAPDPVTYISMLSVALVLSIFLATSRHFLRPHPYANTIGGRPKSYIWTDVFYYAAIGSQITEIGLLLYRTTSEIRYRKEFSHMYPNLPLEDIEDMVFYKMTRPKMLIILFLAGCCYYSSLCLIRGAFLAFYWGLYKRAEISTKWIKVTIIATALLSVMSFVIGLAWCRPIQRNWSPDYDDYVKCTVVNSLVVRAIATATNVFQDSAIILLPISLLARLTLGPRETAALGFVYSVGLVSVVACVTSLVNLVKYFFKEPDSLDTVRLMEMWSMVESTAAIFAFSLPAYKKYILRRFGTHPQDRVRPMRRVQDIEQGQQQQQPQNGDGNGQEGGLEVPREQGNTGTGCSVDVESGTANSTAAPAATPLAQQGGVWNRINGWFGGNKSGPNTPRKKANHGLPSFVRGSLVGGGGWYNGPKLRDLSLSGGSTDVSRNRRRRTLDDLELTSFDDYEDTGVDGQHNEGGVGIGGEERPRETESEGELREREGWGESSSGILQDDHIADAERPNSNHTGTGSGGTEWEIR